MTPFKSGHCVRSAYGGAERFGRSGAGTKARGGGDTVQLSGNAAGGC